MEKKSDGKKINGQTIIDYYLEKFNNVISNVVFTGFNCLYDIVCELEQLKERDGTLFLIGNGGSNAIVSHAAVDILNKYGIKVNVLSDSSMLTCMANDNEYKNVFRIPLGKIMTPKDVLLAVSSSGKSENIIRAVLHAETIGAKTITFTGFLKDNPVRNYGNYNVWLNSDDYMLVETGHSFLLHLLVE